MKSFSGAVLLWHPPAHGMPGKENRSDTRKPQLAATCKQPLQLTHGVTTPSLSLCPRAGAREANLGVGARGDGGWLQPFAARQRVVEVHRQHPACSGLHISIAQV